MRQISLQGHRGARGLLAENTLPSLVKPFEFGMHGIEFDVQLSKDDEVIIYHDFRLKSNITRNSQNKWIEKNGPPVRYLSLKELKQYKLGKINKATAYGVRFRKQASLPDQSIPTLYELVEHLNKNDLGDVLLNIEIKHSPLLPDLCPEPEFLAEKIVHEINKLDISKRCIVQCFNWSVIKAVRKLDSSLPISCLSTIDPFEDTLSPQDGKACAWTANLDIRDFNNNVAEMVAQFNANYWAPNFINLSQELIDHAHNRNLAVMTWTVNHQSTMKRLLNWGVDAIISDYPDKLEIAFRHWKSILPK